MKKKKKTSEVVWNLYYIYNDYDGNYVAIFVIITIIFTLRKHRRLYFVVLNLKERQYTQVSTGSKKFTSEVEMLVISQSTVQVYSETADLLPFPTDKDSKPTCRCHHLGPFQILFISYLPKTPFEEEMQ